MLVSGVPKKALGFCLRTTTSPFWGAISATISLPFLASSVKSSVPREFLPCQRPKATDPSSPWPVVKNIGRCFFRASSRSVTMWSTPTHPSSPQLLRNRLTDSMMGSRRSPTKL